MNKNEILLTMQIDVIVFSNQLNTFISVFSISLNSKALKLIMINFVYFYLSVKDF